MTGKTATSTEPTVAETAPASAEMVTNIHTRLSSVMEEVGAVGKTDRNAQQGFNFRGVDAVVKAVAPALRRHGITVMPTVLDKTREVGATRNGGVMETVYLTVQYTLYGPEGDSVSAIVAAQANDTADKATAKAMSVAYRTFWLQALCIPTDEPDPDLTYTERGNESQAVTTQQVAKISAFRTLVNLSEVFETVLGRPATATDMTFAEGEKVIAHLNGLSKGAA